MNSPQANLLEQNLECYNFFLPKELIAQKRETDISPMLIVDVPTKQLMVSKTSQLDKFMDPGTQYFHNATSVIAARHISQTHSGRVHEIFFIDQDYQNP